MASILYLPQCVNKFYTAWYSQSVHLLNWSCPLTWCNGTLSKLVQVMACGLMAPSRSLNTLRPRQNGRHFADDTFKRIFMNENARISINISLKFVPKGLTSNIPALVQIMAWRRPGDKPLSEPMMINLLPHKCVTRPQWVNQGGLVNEVQWQ